MIVPRAAGSTAQRRPRITAPRTSVDLRSSRRTVGDLSHPSEVGIAEDRLAGLATACWHAKAAHQ
jgi:hypothetical protein